MTAKVKIAIDAMGGENAPKKIIEGINISLKSNKENFFSLYGKKEIIKKEFSTNKLVELPESKQKNILLKCCCRKLL